jgi:hypothetical protein
MKGLGIWMQAISHWLVAWLITKWGVALVLVGTLALAGSASVYLTSTYDHRAQVGGSVPSATRSVTSRSLCMSLVASGALTLPAQCDTTVPAQSLCTTLVVGGALTCTGTLPAIPAQCARSVPVVAYMRREPTHCRQ